MKHDPDKFTDRTKRTIAEVEDHLNISENLLLSAQERMLHSRYVLDRTQKILAEKFDDA